MLRQLRLGRGDPRPATASSPPPPLGPPPPPRPISMIMYDKGLPSLPDDIICEIFGLLDMESLKSCSLTGKALSYSAKPFLHRTLHLAPRLRNFATHNVPGRWNELEGLPTLGERGLLQHTRHISISLRRNLILSYDLEPYPQQLRTLTNLRSLKVRWLDVPSFIPKMDEYFGAFFGSLQSLGLESPGGDCEQILYFVCQFRDLQDLKINSLQDPSRSMRSGGSNFEIKTSPPLNGTLDLHLVKMGTTWGDSNGDQLILSALLALPSGLKFRTLKLSGCVGNNLRLLVDSCGPTLECMELRAQYDGGLSSHRGKYPWLTQLDSQMVPNVLGSVSDATQDSENLESNWPKARPQKASLAGYPKPSQPSPRVRSPS